MWLFDYTSMICQVLNHRLLSENNGSFVNLHVSNSRPVHEL